MFKSKTAVKETVQIETATPELTVALTRASLITKESEAEIEHIAKLARATGREVPSVLLHKGFMTVRADIVTKFRYHASIFEDTSVFSWWTGSVPTFVRYAGDIPDFALDRLEQWKAQDGKVVTIHSNMPLPVETWQPRVIEQPKPLRLEKIDPVLLGWTPDVHIWHGTENRKAEITKSTPPISDWSVSCVRSRHDMPPQTAALLAMWDMDKELVLD